MHYKANQPPLPKLIDLRLENTHQPIDNLFADSWRYLKIGAVCPAPHPAQLVADSFKPARTFLSEPLVPAVLGGSGPANGFQGSGFAAAFFSKLVMQLQFGQSLTGLF